MRSDFLCARWHIQKRLKSIQTEARASMDSLQPRISNPEFRVCSWNRIVWIALAVLTLAVGFEQTARAQGSASGSSFSSAAAVGAPISAIVELSDMYRAPENYDVKITVLEILRGKPATDLLTKSAASKAPAQSDFECVLARIRFEYAARGAPGDKPWELTAGQFNAFSADGKPYEMSSIEPPEPRLHGRIRSGDFLQGWIAFAVAIKDKKPVMSFVPGSIWFQLY
jgi:hypothetical protein